MELCFGRINISFLRIAASSKSLLLTNVSIMYLPPALSFARSLVTH